MGPYAIRTNKLIRDFSKLRALDELSIEVPTGSVFGFLGPNGAGKTTTIRLLLGLLEPTGGQAQVLGHDTRSTADRIRLQSGALLEHNGLYERLSAESNLEFYARVWKIGSEERQARIRELLQNLDLWERRGEPVANWSRGMKQKLAMARALLHRPALLFLDEPTAGLDPAAAAQLRDDLENLVNREGVTVFLNTHNLAEAERLCQQIGIIRQGKLVANGSPTELRVQASNPRVVITGRGFSPELVQGLRSRSGIVSAELQEERLVVQFSEAFETAPLVSELVKSGAQVEEVIKTQSSLEDVFLSLVNEDEQHMEQEP
jgi:ABC-2 type transport system ATP-binding protein